MKKLIVLCLVLVACSAFANKNNYEPGYTTIFFITKNDIICLAKNIYFEARDQSPKGQIAVVCKVVEQTNRKNGKIVLHKCHFSWFCDGKSDIPKNKMSWNISLLIANAMLKNKVKDFLHGSTHYHRIDVDPYWNKRMLKFSTIGDHIFYIDALNR